MDALLKSELFFAITSVSVVILTVLIAVLLLYLLRVARDVKDISKKAKEEADNIIADVGIIRRTIEAGGNRVKRVVTKPIEKFRKKNKA